MMSKTLNRWLTRAALIACVSVLSAGAHAERAHVDPHLAIPPDIVQALSDVSVASHAWQAGVVTPDDAASAMAVAVGRLTAAWGELETADPRTILAASRVALLHLGPVAIPLMLIPSEEANPRLAGAVIDWVVESGRVLEALGPMAPENPCFLNFTRCAAYCVRLDAVMQRAACMLDCEISLLACVGDALIPILGGPLTQPGSGSPTFP